MSKKNTLTKNYIVEKSKASPQKQPWRNEIDLIHTWLKKQSRSKKVRK